MKPFLAKLAAFSSVLLMAQVAWYFYSKPPTPTSVQKARDVAASGADILYFGDSIISATDAQDRDPRKLSTLVSEKLLPYQTKFIAHPGFTFEVFAEFCRYFRNANFHPRVVVAPFNLRTLSSSYLRPEYQFVREKRELWMATSAWLEPFRIPAFVFKTFELSPISTREWKQIPVFDEGHQVGLVKDYFAENSPPHQDAFLKRKFVWHYLGPIDEGHSQFQALRRLSAEIDRQKTQIIAYATPIDVELGQRVVGPRFLPTLRERIRTTAGVMRELGITFHDLSETVPNDGFYIQRERTVSEHLNERGRHTLSETISDLIKGDLQAMSRQISNEGGPK